MHHDQAAIAALTKLNLDDLFNALGIPQLRGLAVLQRALRPYALRLATQVTTYDHLVGENGLQAGATYGLNQLVRRSEVCGQANIPREGPLLIVANHPGLYDTLALFSAIPRPDLYVIAADRPFLRALPHIARRLLMIDDAASGRMGVVRAATRHMRAGGALLLFPGGKIEPDPATMPGAVAALSTWSESVEIFGRLVPQLQALPAIVSGVLGLRAQRHPLVRLRRSQAERELLAATLQMIAPSLHDLTVRVAFGPPLRRADFARGNQAALAPALLASAARLMEDARQAAR
ncbi:MAG: 1-acyl-sn-glycerol-3-phosphate acyltransferase [Roseiflexaceae bacterium]|nr:1-acyl-sn-glycerol-3-phosphate acyltransferase [Roseiflexaceae bacterium]